MGPGSSPPKAESRVLVPPQRRPHFWRMISWPPSEWSPRGALRGKTLWNGQMTLEKGVTSKMVTTLYFGPPDSGQEQTMRQ